MVLFKRIKIYRFVEVYVMRITGSLLKKTGQDGLKLMNMIHYLLKNEDKSTIQELQIKFIKK